MYALMGCPSAAREHIASPTLLKRKNAARFRPTRWCFTASTRSTGGGGGGGARPPGATWPRPARAGTVHTAGDGTRAQRVLLLRGGFAGFHHLFGKDEDANVLFEAAKPPRSA